MEETSISKFVVAEGNWQIWYRNFNIYIEAKGIEKDTRKTNLLLHMGGSELIDIYYTLPISQEENPKYVDVVKALDEYFAPLVNKRYERHLFRKIYQLENETLIQYVTRLKKQGKKCKFTDLDDEILDQIIDKCCSSELRTKLLEKGDKLKLRDALEIGKNYEVINIQSSEMNKNMECQTAAEILRIKKKTDSKEKAKKCYRCGQDYSKSHKCPAINATCYKCNGKNHFANV